MKQVLLVSRLLCVGITVVLFGCSSPRDGLASIRLRWAHDPETLDPLQTSNQPALEAVNLLHMSLLQADFSRMKQAPALAESLPVAQLVGDSLTHLRYTLRQEAFWNTGRPVLASDVAFTLKLMFCPGIPAEVTRARFGFIREIRFDSTNARRFVLVCRGQSFEYLQASGDFPILSEAALDPGGRLLRRFTLAQVRQRPLGAAVDSALRTVARHYQAADPAHFPGRLPGCGPYELVKWEKDRYLRFRRKAHWWADRLRPAPLVLQAKPRQLDYLIIPDAATATLALRRGDLDVFPQMPAREFDRLRKSAAAQGALRFYTTSSYDVVTAGFNTRRPALADALTRRALSRCFDAAALLRATQLGGGQRTVGIISPADRVNYNDSLALVPFDPGGASALLCRAGWQRGSAKDAGWFRQGPGGTRQQLQLAVRYRTDEALFATVALQFQAAAAGLGIPVKLQPTESGAFTVALDAGDFDLYLRVLKGNPFLFNFTPLLHSLGVGAGNSTGFSTPASDRLIDAIALAGTETQRARLLRRFQALMQAEAPMVPLFFLPNRVVAARRLTGLHVSSLKPGFSAATIERAPAPLPVP